GPRDYRHQTVLTDKRQARRLGVSRFLARDRQPPQTSVNGKEYLPAVGHPGGMVGVQRGWREALRLSGWSKVLAYRHEVEFPVEQGRGASINHPASVGR